MGKLKSFIKRLSNFSLVFIILIWQVVFAGAPLLGTAHAASAATLEQCRNGSLLSPDLCNDSTSNTGWVAGNAGASDSHWREGDSLPYRMLFTGLSTTGSHSITINWDTTKSGKHALDYLTTYNRTETSTDPCYNVSGCSGAPSSTAAIPQDQQVVNAGVTPVSGNFSLWGGSISSVTRPSAVGNTTCDSSNSLGDYCYPDGTGFSGDKSAAITINFTASVSNPVLAWGGHIASQVDWGFGNSASAIQGSPYHMRLIDLDGSGGNQDRSLAAAAVFPTPTITTQTSSANVYVGNTVTDTATLTGPSSPLTGTVDFYVCGPSNTNPDCTTGGNQVGGDVSVTEVTQASKNTDAVSTATSSTYQVTQPGQYCFRAEYTPASDAPYSPQNHTNQSSTSPNNECFTATYAPSSITIIKDAQPDSSQTFHYTTSGGLSTDQNGFDLSDPGSGTTNTRVFNNVGPGTYTVSEQDTTGWDFKSLDCGSNAAASIVGKTVTITITGGQSVSCTYTNAERGTITVHKVTYPANDTTNFSVTAHTTDGNISGNATQNDLSTSNDVVYDVSQGHYSVTEAAASGWSEDDSDCSSLTVDSSHLSVSCTVYNTKLAKLKIIKATSPSSSAQTFNFSSTGPSITNLNDSFVLDTNTADNTYPNNYQYTNLTPGTYSVTETEPSGWVLTGLSCSGISYTWPGNTQTLSLDLPAGADVTCTYTNSQYSSISGYKYEVNADGSTVGPLSDWTIYLNDGTHTTSTTTDSSGYYSFENLLAGSFSITEDTTNDHYTQLSGFQTICISPSYSINLSNGQTSTGNDFCNFHNASISGYKFNDKNGNGIWDKATESGLQGWTITLFDNGGSGALLNHQVSQTTTGADGSYSFTNLPPTTYKVCETQQTGWIQTYPDNTGCQLVNVTLSGHEYSNTNFGNQGRGTITVVKNVDDGFGNITSDVTNWNWGYSGTLGSASGLSTGSTNHQSVAAGDYTVSETQKSDYHVTASSCTGETDNTVSTSKSVTVSPGEDVTCTFTNTRNTGTIEVVKNLLPSTDSGLFDLNIDGTTKAPDVTDGGTTDPVTVVTGTHEVSETAGTNTSLNNYESSYVCTDNGQQVKSGDGTSVSDISVAYGDEVVCTFTNTRHATITIIKDVDTNGDGTVDQTDSNNWTWWYDGGSNGFNEDLATGSNNTQEVVAGGYTIGEDQQNNYHFTSVVCSDVSGSVPVDQAEQIDVTLDPGENLTCTFTNTRDTGTISGTKFNDLNGNGKWDQGEPGLQGWTITLSPCETLFDAPTFELQLDGQQNCGDPIATTQTDKNGDYSFDNVPTNTELTSYKVCEVLQTGWLQTYPADNNGCYYVTLYEDGQVAADVNFGNFQNGTISGFKFSDPNGNGKYDNGEQKLSGWTITLSKSDGNGGWTQINSTSTDSSGNYSFTNLPPADYQVCEVPQDGWIRIFPTSSNCQTETINQSGQTVTALFANQKKTTPKVLGATTVLANTGQSAWEGVVAGLLMLGLIAGINTTAFILAKKQR